LSFFVDFWNNIDYYGEYESIMEQMTKTEAEKQLNDSSFKTAYFLIQKKDGTNIGLIAHFGQSSGSITIGYALMPSEQGKGYGTKALQLMVDYLFLPKRYVESKRTLIQKTRPVNVYWRKWASRKMACPVRAALLEASGETP